MNNEQAIQAIKEHCYFANLVPIAKEALDMAIKALEIVEEFEKAQIITGGRLNGRAYAYQCGLRDGERKAIEQHTSQKKKVGKWIKVSETEFGIGYQCSECGRFILTESIDGRKLEDFPYCHCGAVMRGNENE